MDYYDSLEDYLADMRTMPEEKELRAMHFVSVAWDLIGTEYFTETAGNPVERARHLNTLSGSLFSLGASWFVDIKPSSFTSNELPSDFASAEEAYRNINPDQAESDRQAIVSDLQRLQDLASNPPSGGLTIGT